MHQSKKLKNTSEYQRRITNTFWFEIISESQYGQYKIKCLQNSFIGSLWKFNGAEEYIKKRIQELCNEKKSISRRGNLLKSYKHHFECSVIYLISFALCINLIFFALSLL